MAIQRENGRKLNGHRRINQSNPNQKRVIRERETGASLPDNGLRDMYKQYLQQEREERLKQTPQNIKSNMQSLKEGIKDFREVIKVFEAPNHHKALEELKRKQNKIIEKRVQELVGEWSKTEEIQSFSHKEIDGKISLVYKKKNGEIVTIEFSREEFLKQATQEKQNSKT